MSYRSVDPSRSGLRRKLLTPALAWIFAGAPACLPSAAHAAVALPDSFVNEIVVGGLDQPTSFAFLPDGRVLLTEQHTGKVRLVVGDHIASTDPILLVPQLSAAGYERGLQGIAVDPGWPVRPFVYLYYTRIGGYCRLVRYLASGDLADPAGETLALTDPLLILDNIPDADPNHQAGCLRFGPTGHLFLTLGEDEDLCAAYDSTSLKGQLLRLDVSSLPPGPGGTVPRGLIIPPDNPLSTSDSNALLVWAYGMRNPWRFHIDPVTERIYLADVGEGSYEEINEVLPGDYLGWPYREADLVMVRSTCAEPGGEGSVAYKSPILAMFRGGELTAILSAGIYRPVIAGTANWPAEYDGDVFYGEYYSGILRRLKQTGGTWAPANTVPGQPDAQNWGTGFSWASDFLIGPNGDLWWLRQFDDDGNSITGTLQRVRYVGSDTVSTPTLVSLVSARATPDRVSLTWYVPETAFVATLERREEVTGWQTIAAVTANGTGYVTYEDLSVEAGHRYEYRLRVAGVAGTFGETWVDVPSGVALAALGLRPNPVRGDSRFEFSLPANGPARVEFIDVTGRRVLTRELGVETPGNHVVSLGDTRLRPGVYALRLVQGGRVAYGRAVILD